MTLRFTVAVVLICLTGSGLASELFGVNFPAATPLFSLNQSSGRLTSIGPTSFADIADLTSDRRPARCGASTRTPTSC